jgi:hypothetical protein
MCVYMYIYIYIYIYRHLLSPLSNTNFQIDSMVEKEMIWLKTYYKYGLTINCLNNYQKEFVMIQSLNTHSLMKQKYKILIKLKKLSKRY